jgi:phenylacetate-CoA ligase
VNLGTLRDALTANPLTHALLARLPDRWTLGSAWTRVLALQALAGQGRHDEVEQALRGELAAVLDVALTHVPHYRDSLGARVKPADIRPETARDLLAEFPLLHKAEVMAEPRRFVDERLSDRQLTFGTSGGSTGQGMAIFGDRATAAAERAFFQHHWGPLGYHPLKARMARFSTSARRTQDEDPCRRAGNLLYISPWHLNRRWLPRIVEALREFAPQVIWSYPSCVRDLAMHLRETGGGLPSLRACCLASEACPEGDYRIIRDTLGCPVSLNYGLSERSNLAFSRETSAGLVYDLDPLYAVSETCQDEEGATELVGTMYWNRAMPLIRYRTQDLVRLDGNVIVELQGRVQEVLVGRGGERIPGFSIKIDEYTWEHVDAYQVVQTERGHLLLKVVPRADALPESFAERLLASQRSRLGDIFEITLEETRAMDRTPRGKQRLIVSHLA